VSDALLPTYARAPLAFVRGEGSWLYDADDNAWLDLAAGIAVNALGHAHPRLVAALTSQAQRLWHVSNLYEIPAQRALAERLVSLTFADQVFFTNSGTEACELAVKMVRRHFHEAGQPERVEIITFSGAFHGRSAAAIAAAGSEKLTRGFAPLLEGFVHVPFGDHDALRAAVGERTAAVLVEPVQGEGGIRALPAVCLQGLRALCDEHGLLLVLDEVQCGVGRTGRLFAHEHAGIRPDVMMVAKGIGGGFPLGAVLATRAAGAAMQVGSHGSTYGGNPLGCAVGLALLDLVADPDFLADVRRHGDVLHDALATLVEAHPQVFAGVRGVGLMLGLECRVPVAEVVAAAREARLLCVPAADDVVRLLPPLNITGDELVEAVSRLRRAAQALEAQGVADRSARPREEAPAR
jgi:acetylornithine/N-succinyldiaminopimelate aminotransferase